MHCMVECFEATDEKDCSTTEFHCGIVQVEFWHLFNSYIGNEESSVEDRMDAEYEWIGSNSYMRDSNIHNRCSD